MTEFLLLYTGNTKSGPLIQHMWDQEKEHLRVFEQLIPKYRARPTAMLPFWNVAGYVLGAGKYRRKKVKLSKLFVYLIKICV